MKKPLVIVAMACIGVLIGYSPARGSAVRTGGQAKDADPLTGEEITAEEAAALEQGLATDPSNFRARQKLIVYYFRAKLKDFSAETEENWERNVLWVIEHHPESQIAGTPYADILPMATPETEAGYQRGKELWLAQTGKHPHDRVIVRHAAQYLMVLDGRTACGLLENALAADPRNVETASLLAHAYELAELHARTPAEKEELAQKALSLREHSASEGDAEQRFNQLGDMSRAAFEAGDNTKAEEYATDLLQDAEKFRNSWNYGNAVHSGNIVLGRIALRRGDVAGAKAHLLAAGGTPGSPQLDSFGPNMMLAQELLAKGERETVLTYLEACGKFWNMGGDTLKNWIETVKGGGTPDFGGNLLY